MKDDTIWLDNAVFKKLGKGSLTKKGKLDKEFFVIDTKARESDDYLIYNKKTGVLSYDADGSGSKKAVEIATLTEEPQADLRRLPDRLMLPRREGP